MVDSWLIAGQVIVSPRGGGPDPPDSPGQSTSGLPEGAMLALLGPWDDHRIGGTVGDPSCHQGVLGPCREGHGAYEEPGVLVQEDLGSQENGLEESGCLGFGPEHPFGYSWCLPIG